MKMVTLTINGREIQAQAGQTILDVARTSGIDIPTLCHHPSLANIGACRMCLVEIQKVPALQPACTYPASNGLVIETHSARTVHMRKFILEMLFSERNHYCMFCEMSGDCQLQNLAYSHGLTSWSYPTPYPKVAVDGSSKFLIMDHNRCILCRRCIRACGDLVGNHTLGVRSRGAKTMICADMDVPFGESSCVSCGTCLQVCPTGALIDRKSAYMGREIDVAKTLSSCTFCSVGCKTQVVMRGGHPLRVEGCWDGANGGVMCSTGRFDPFFDDRIRITSPMLRNSQGDLKPVSWDEALDAIAGKLKARNGDKLVARTTGKALNECLEAFTRLFGKKVNADVGTLESTLSKPELPMDARLQDLDQAECILMIGVDPLEDHRVVGYRILRAKRKGTRVLLVSDTEIPSSRLATDRFSRSVLPEAIEICLKSPLAVVVYGGRLIEEDGSHLARLAGRAKFLPLFPSSNGRGARKFGLDLNPGDGSKPAVAYVLALDSTIDHARAAEFRKADFLIVHSTYMTSLAEHADVVLPSTLWPERNGSFVTTEGVEVQVRGAAPIPSWMAAESEVIAQLERRL